MSPFLSVSLALFAAWAILLFLSPRTRQEQMLMSAIGLVLAPAAIAVATTDYRAGSGVTGGIGIEDLLFAFSVFGIAAVAYHAAFGRHASRLRGRRIRFGHPAAHWLAHIVIALCAWGVIALSLTTVLRLSTAQAAIVGGLLVGTYVIADRKDLLFNALFSGAFMAVLVFAAEQLFFVRLYPEAAAAFWQGAHLSGFALAGIPLEEVLWAGVVGFTVGPLYEYMRDLRSK